MKRKIAIAFITLLTINVAMGAPKPKKCPSFDVIQATEWSKIVKNKKYPGFWILIQERQTYNTENEWNFSLEIKAKNMSDALIKGSQQLKEFHVYLQDGPIGDERYFWGCHYWENNGLVGDAVTPPPY